MKPGFLFLCVAIALVADARPIPSEAAKDPANPPPVARNFRVEKLADGVYAVLRSDPPGMMCDGNSAFIVNEDGSWSSTPRSPRPKSWRRSER
jgi:hypothetical protein